MTMTAAEIAELSDDELNRVIAELLGWAIEEEVEYPYGHDWGPLWTYQLFSPDGKCVFAGNDEDLADQLPQWSTDANAALELLAEIVDISYGQPCQGELGRIPDPYPLNPEIAGLWYVKRCGNHGLCGKPKAPTAPRAIAEAYVLWRQERE